MHRYYFRKSEDKSPIPSPKLTMGVYSIPGVGIIAVDEHGNTCVIDGHTGHVRMNDKSDVKTWFGQDRLTLVEKRRN